MVSSTDNTRLTGVVLVVSSTDESRTLLDSGHQVLLGHAIHIFSLTSPVLGYFLLLFPTEPCLRDICIEVIRCFQFHNISLTRVFHAKACLVIGRSGVWLSHGVAKPFPTIPTETELSSSEFEQFLEVFISTSLGKQNL